MFFPHHHATMQHEGGVILASTCVVVPITEDSAAAVFVTSVMGKAPVVTDGVLNDDFAIGDLIHMHYKAVGAVGLTMALMELARPIVDLYQVPEAQLKRVVEWHDKMHPVDE